MFRYYPFDKDLNDWTGALPSNYPATVAAGVSTTTRLNRFGGGSLYVSVNTPTPVVIPAMNFFNNNAWTIALWIAFSVLTQPIPRRQSLLCRPCSLQLARLSTIPTTALT